MLGCAIPKRRRGGKYLLEVMIHLAGLNREYGEVASQMIRLDSECTQQYSAHIWRATGEHIRLHTKAELSLMDITPVGLAL